jgi:hypothetical protein
MLLQLLILLIIGAVVVWWLFKQGYLPPKPALTARGAGTDGSARWAYDVAVLRAKSALASDAVVVEISGADVLTDGRLAANRGKWTLHFSSFSAAARLPVMVDHLRAVTVGATSSPGVIHALGAPPGTFPDSIAIFAATVGKGAAGTRTVNGQVTCRRDSVAGSHVWSIPLKAGGVAQTHRVRWDGIWLEVL